MSELLTVLLILIQPVLWLGILRNYIIYRKRLTKQRRDFNTSIYANNYEIKHFWLSFVVLGILGSAISIVLGVYLPITWIVVYQLLLIINLVLIPGQFLNLITFGIATVITWLIYQVKFFNGIDTLGINVQPTSFANVLLLLTIVILLMSLYVRFVLGNYANPQIFKNQRGNKVAGYLTKEFTVLPLLVLIPGDQIQQVMHWWPVFGYGDHKFSLLILPVMLGMRITIFKSLPKAFFKKLAKKIAWLVVLGVILSGVTYYFKDVENIALYSIAGLIVLYIITVLMVKRSDSKQDTWFSDAVNGLRVISIRPDTPAEKMGVQIGDLIVEVNNIKINSEDEFYKAILTSPTFCRLKVLNREERIKIMESAIYSDSPNELGVVLIKEK